MRLDRWVLPLAIMAAVFTAVAIVPPGGSLPRALRMEAVGGVTPGRPLLVRLSIEDPETGGWETPRSVQVWQLGRQARVEDLGWTVGVPYRFLRVLPDGAGACVLGVRADGLSATVTVPVVSGIVAPREVSATRAHDIDVVAEGGALVPEVPGTVLIRVENGAGATVSMEAGDAPVRFTPTRARLDACGVAAFETVVTGLDAHVVVHATGTTERRTRRRLPVVPGGLVIKGRPGMLEVSTAVGGRAVYVLGGDRNGVTYWTAVRLDDPVDTYARAQVELPASVAWVAASLSPVFEQPVSLWLTDPPGALCTGTDLGARFARAVTSSPPWPDVVVVHDGAAMAREIRARRQQRVRYGALSLAGLAVAMLVGLVLSAGLRGDPEALRGVSLSSRQRMAIALGGAGALLVGGLVLFFTFLLRT